jgi:diaminopimelate decarboxylase/aspartate kinase
VTVTLDPTANHLDPATLDSLQEALGTLCRAQVLGPCATVSLVGRNIRRMLHELGGALGVFEEQRIHLVSQAANDLNLSFVVDADQADRLVRQLHGQLFAHSTESSLLGPTWEESFSSETGPAQLPWWETRREDLLALVKHDTPLYVYDQASLVEASSNLHGLANVDRVFFAVKANPHPDILRCFERQGLGFECVSPGELAHVQEVLPDLPPDRLLFTPNFAPREEYAQALAAEIPTTLDNLHPLEAWPDIFRGRAILLRLDPGRGRGHHAHVRTAGRQSKFGIAPEQVERAAELAKAAGARVIGLHAHAGSGIRNHESWAETAAFLAGFASRFPELQILDLGGGLGIPSKPGELPLDLEALDATLAQVRSAHPGLSLWLEPGRYLVAQAGVLLATVTQTKTKGDVHYVGIDAGMNTLIRPALYGAWHHIVNLTRLEAPLDQVAHVVGPICETGDTLGYQRHLATAQEGDVLLIATVGAYGRSMSSHYNLRAPATESFLT